jgi:hypothetical protein
MNVTEKMIAEAYSHVPEYIEGDLERCQCMQSILIASAILECDKTLAIIAQKVLDTFP